MIMRQQSAMLLEYVQVLPAIVMLFVCQSVQWHLSKPESCLNQTLDKVLMQEIFVNLTSLV